VAAVERVGAQRSAGGELCALAGRRQSLVSYHLRQLRDGGLVSMRRSAADGRDTYYVLDLARCGELLSSAGVALTEQLSDGAVSAASAGSHPKPLHPNAVRVMRDRGIDLAGRRSSTSESSPPSASIM
jgi:ArsR family transcriptional regulator, arsenate/arsenite/antimonite-responsive transcriptional repressor / arsenate reductase (thioredoxin)